MRAGAPRCSKRIKNPEDDADQECARREWVTRRRCEASGLIDYGCGSRAQSIMFFYYLSLASHVVFGIVSERGCGTTTVVVGPPHACCRIGRRVLVCVPGVLIGSVFCWWRAERRVVIDGNEDLSSVAM
jgi:hypothetical protein